MQTLQEYTQYHKQKVTVSLFILTVCPSIFKTENINRHCKVRPLTFMATCARSATVLFMVTLNTKVTSVPVVYIFTLLF